MTPTGQTPDDNEPESGRTSDDVIRLGVQDAKRCARRIHNEWDPSIEKIAWEAPADLQARFDAGLEHEDRVLAAVAAAYGPDRCVDLRGRGRKAALIDATAVAVSRGVDVILGGWLPDDVDGGRTGRPDLLVHVGGGRYVPGEVKGHKMLVAAKRSATPCAGVGALAQPGPRDGLGVRTSKQFDDFLQLAHYWRMLEAAGWAPDGDPAGFVIGTDDAPSGLESAHVAVWLDLTKPHFTTFSRSAGKAKRTRRSGTTTSRGFGRRLRRPRGPERLLWWNPSSSRRTTVARGSNTASPSLGRTMRAATSRRGRLDVREWTALRSIGVVTLGQLAALDLGSGAVTSSYLPEVTHQRDPRGRLGDAVRRARMSTQGTVIERKTGGPIQVSRADVEIDLDVESDPSGRVYLWGALVSRGGGTPTYHSFVDFDPLDDMSEKALATELVARLGDQRDRAEAEGLSLLVYHYSPVEKTHLRRVLGKDQVGDLLGLLVDLRTVVQEHFFGVDGLGVMKVAPVFGFTWRDEDPGGLQSQLWLAEARAATDEETRVATQQRRLAYNEDDVRATHAIRNGL